MGLRRQLRSRVDFHHRADGMPVIGKNRLARPICFFHLEVPTGFEPVITELQSIALPLGYGTISQSEWWGQWDLNPHGISPNGF